MINSSGSSGSTHPSVWLVLSSHSLIETMQDYRWIYPLGLICVDLVSPFFFSHALNNFQRIYFTSATLSLQSAAFLLLQMKPQKSNSEREPCFCREKRSRRQKNYHIHKFLSFIILSKPDFHF